VTRNGIARLLANGVNDATFQPGTAANGSVLALARQSDGKILVGGDFTTFNSMGLPYLVRLNEDGSVDSSFSSAEALNGSVRSIALQPDGRIIIAGGFTAVGTTPRPYIARLNADGT